MKTILALTILSILTKSYADLTNGLVAYYPFSGDALDASGNGYTGIVHNASLTSDRFGSAASAYWFNGINADIEIGNQPIFNFADDFTLSVWVSATEPQLAKYVLGKYYAYEPDAYGLGTSERGSMYAFVQNDPQEYNRPEIRSHRILSIGKWH